MIDWVIDGDVLGHEDGGAFAPADVADVWSAFGSEGGRLEAGDRQLAAARWVLTPTLVFGEREGRAVAWIEASGGSVSGIASTDPRVLGFGHLVSGSMIYPLESGALGHLKALLAGEGIAIGPLSFPQAIALRRLAAANDLLDDRLVEISPRLFGKTPNVATVPAGVAATLFPYQLDGWRWLRFLGEHGVGGLLGDEMGLGKTLQVIALISDPGDAELAPVLVVAPGTLLENWRRELAKFAPAIEVLIHKGEDRTGRPAELTRHRVVVTSYDTLMRDIGLMGTVRWGAVVLDEAQAIRNPSAKRTSAVCALHRERGFAMTGTPLENRLMDIWSIMNFVAPGYLGTRGEFERRFGDDIDGALALEPLITPLMLRPGAREPRPDRMGSHQVVADRRRAACALQGSGERRGGVQPHGVAARDGVAGQPRDRRDGGLHLPREWRTRRG